MTQYETKGGIVAIDIARGLAALSVFIYHYQVGTVIAGLTGNPVFEYIDVPGARFGVLLFFLVSGFCIHGSQLKIELRSGTPLLDLADYFWRRFWRIYPAYLVALFFSCTVMSLAGQHADLYDFLLHFTLLHGLSSQSFNSINLVLWTISIEAGLYILYPIWHALRRRIGASYAAAAGIGLSCISMALCSLTPTPLAMPILWLPTNLWAGWLFGAWLAERTMSEPHSLHRAGWWWCGGLFYASLLIAYCLGLLEGKGFIVIPSALTIAFAWPLSAVIVAQHHISNYRSIIARAFRDGLIFLGNFSYSLYLLHEPLISLRNIAWIGIRESALRQLFWPSGFS